MKRIYSLLWVVMTAAAVMAVPARQGGYLRTAADGTEKIVYLHGNEHFHYITDEAGRWLDEVSLRPLTEKEKSERLAVSGEREARRAVQQTAAIGGKPNPAPRGLVILVNFTDKSFVTPIDTLKQMHNGDHFTRCYSYDYEYKDPSTGKTKTYHYDGSSIGSVRQYFYDQSYGQYNPQFDLIGPLTLSNKMSYYGGNSSSQDGSDKNVAGMIKEACQLADQAGVDFSIYDNDKDGYVDFVYVIYAGYGEADGGGTETIWPHQWYLKQGAGITLTLDGKTIDRYACGSELSFWSKRYAGIGTFVHEFSHVLGLPDVYAVNNATHKTSGAWDTMDYGVYNNDGNTPAPYTAYERFYMGRLTPRMLSKAENVTLYPINEDGGSSLLISTGSTHNLSGWNPDPTTFYLLETHSSDGWDEYLPGPGMLITKVTFNSSSWYNNSVNNTANSLGIDILEADGKTPSKQQGVDNGYRGKPGDAFPAGAAQWTAYTDHEITDITRDATTGAVSFKYRGGVATALESNQPSEGSIQKRIINGRVVILRGGKTYDILGYENHQL